MSSKLARYLQSLMTAIASILFAPLFPIFVTAFRDIGSKHAPGLTVVAGGMLEGVLSGEWLVLFLFGFSWFYFAGHSPRRWVRLLLFWIPACLTITLGFAAWLLIVYVLRMKH